MGIPMQPTRTVLLAAATLLLAAQAALRAGTTTVVVPNFLPSHTYGGPAGAPNRAAVALAQAGSSAVAQTQAPPSVTFQVEVNYVDIDTIVSDEKGNFVSGLSRADFDVFEDGKPQKIEMFSYVELPVAPDDRFTVINRAVTSDARSNSRAFDGRVYVIVLDDLDISPLRGGLVKNAAREFVERHLGSNDLAAVVYTSGRPDATQDFTSDRGLLLAAVDKFVGRRLRSAAIEALERHYHNEL